MTQSVRVVGAHLGDRSAVTVEPQLTVSMTPSDLTSREMGSDGPAIVIESQM